MALNVVLMLASTAAVADEYRLGVSDRVKIKVQEWPDLAGEYTITADGDISLPQIGNIHVVGERLSDLSREISKQLQRRASGGEPPIAAVEMVQYRPFSIVGDVQRPGDYPYRPGLTVLKAISIASGYYRPEFGLLRLDRDIALAKGQIRELSLKQNRLLARQARLTAALAGNNDFTVPPSLAEQRDDPSISVILDSERAVLALENDTSRSEKAALENIKTLYQREIDSLNGQVQALAGERETTEVQLKQLRALSTKGLALAPTLFTLERALAQIVNEQMAIETAITKAHESVALAEQGLHERSLERKRKDTQELRETKDQLSELRTRIRTEVDLLTEAEISAPAEARARLAARGQQSTFTIIRRDGQTTREIAADEMTSVLPDDIVKVPVIHPEPYAPSDVANLSGSSPAKADR
ncbi:MULTISPECIES: polysaccharide biosynthesis/export family protein [unclassified Bradyrhizobium]|uniref:polysaccharide biosynthesis/export family protein n=1 Tax=unclassified Bradyrhizobium TaxID=2631580 RepID=UPI0024798649|nr:MULTISPECIES: polysaccharide biosynthesis/export family protein [unclassified Bradyrhizobium]WGR68659.1 polysaccharide biosynthesis/export family protein [Bradyrhizobium sp. ISRA426]WGR80714.1 polysaccharide biosynthesis/export family protein [Bradyrhizobium sp. ISRA430]WGR83899.1 polysaccharide biosynthesis/export family protein [Bradyrhizobium sp. ISRA432]